jgi:hypothetical protein
MDKEKIIREYYHHISRPEEIWYSHDKYMAELGLTEEEVDAYRDKLSSELSFKPAEKKDIVVKELIKPMLKEYGFTVGGNTWCRKIEDNLKLVIHMEGHRFSNAASGAIFQLIVSLFDSKNGSKPQFGVGEMSMILGFSCHIMGCFRPYIMSLDTGLMAIGIICLLIHRSMR